MVLCELVLVPMKIQKKGHYRRATCKWISLLPRRSGRMKWGFGDCVSIFMASQL